ncbi:bifunctional tRNA (5-methylaminomethyl-2-thiouridine)(34)-methyltransferase MnmD/FAD-dependent 5-carboxymethylaminomethyl-2-thiouridine(34) oxidoreductase MnmC [Microbulbifer yueqingensis]|uniref:tRNA 5-methylaminomethyl-2-thiouridine biosynthesis bifunctional protein MnmC n=1 Tax=Microbulbifer yueqingensis TaxID=658219 RepID=A0A1G9ASA5_9GAMM|nr:bifunctional tRNA (5-methylaminomethyl-2-thiouridine)(34)-methyltransferase MnmD/FAD-dependent 5-carboxymethylaminomethyl-2-thiouridine(34) oxidoreductase MnmC [Microbulbifer yueqingensis]SDK30131.1 tRNA 5-methylaminomethyl-2-thiouridine biosynthesis bifunctional protein [Microbulbifer yueqingensis]
MSDWDPGAHPHAEIVWRDDGQPLSQAFDDVYFSSASGLEESRYVFLQQNRLAERWRELPPGARFAIGETGFGTGLNFLAAWQLWDQTAPADARLHFISVEKYPLRSRDLSRALSLWPELAPFSEQLLAAYPPLLASGVHRLLFGRVSLTLVIGEASGALQSLRLEDSARDRQVDAWFLDGFAPAKNPAMWSSDLFQEIATLSRPGASFATFTCAGLVKRGLQGVGFDIEKAPGFGHKREMLRGQLSAAPEAPTRFAYSTTPWHLPGRPGRVVRRVAVIGAGISGASVARALAQRGLQVSVFERGPHAGAGASGNDQGILYAKLSPKPGPNGDFNLHALLFALRYYREFCPEAFHACGMLQLAQDEKEAALQAQVAERLRHQDAGALARPVDAREASELAGLPLDFGGLYFPGSGWLEPRRVCESLLRHDRIQLYCDSGVDALEGGEDGWQLRVGTTNHSVDAVVVCSATGMAQFGETAALPLNPIRGQVSRAAAGEHSRRLAKVLCGEGYLTPAADDWHSFGATFKLRETATETRETEHRENLEMLEAMLPRVAREFAPQHLGGRAAVRAATPDYLPLAGPVPDWEALEESYAGLRRNRKQLIPRTTPYHPGLFVLGGLGSRGFTYAPLAAEAVTAWVTAEPMPLDSGLVRALHPARFAIRALGRNRRH